MDTIACIEEHADVLIEDIHDLTDADWLSKRKLGVGGSDAAAAIGLSPYVSPFALWHIKTTSGYSVVDNEAMEAGRRLEGVIGEWYGEREGIDVRRYPKMLRSKDHPHMLVNLDFIGPERVIEVKNVGFRMAEEWEHGKVPDHYMLQGQHSLAVTGLPAVDFAVLIGGQELRSVTVERNDSLIDALTDAEASFWHMVENGTPPSADGSDATTRAIKDRWPEPIEGESVELPMDIIHLIHERKLAKKGLKEAEWRVDAVENSIKAMLGDAEFGRLDGRVVVSWKLITRKGYTVDEAQYRRLEVPKR
jgi:putative phage-type endonuclease